MINFRVLGGIGNILWQISARVKRFGKENIGIVPGNNKVEATLKKWINPKILKIHNRNDGYIDGYYQDPYWLCPPEEVISWLNLDTTTVPGTVKDFQLVVHVRGGDFLTSAAHMYCHQKEEYINAIIDELNLSKSDVLIITDDVNRTKDSIGKGWHCMSTSDDICAFKIMLQAKYLLIMPGSTFSWWAGYLGEHNKVFIPYGQWPCDKGFLHDVTSTQCSEDFVYNLPLEHRLVFDGIQQ